jgi:anaerobic dimethyl sulfoxide reductase subunit B (iron-sulfur subunit)
MSLGFYYDQTSCIGCKTCQVACKDKNNLDIDVLFRTVADFEAGSFPTPGVFYLSLSCNHCETPACMAFCPHEAISKGDDGVVLIDSEKCDGCGGCVEACPFGVPTPIPSTNKVGKCDSCIQLRENGELNACVAACSMRALDFGDIDSLKAKYGGAPVVALPPYFPEGNTMPNILINAKSIAQAGGAQPTRY